MKKIVVLGSTGSVGRNVLNVVRESEDFKVIALAVNQNIDLLERQILEFKPAIVCVYNEDRAKILRRRQPFMKIISGREGLEAIASLSEADLVFFSLLGNIGLFPLISAIRARKRIAIANKEPLVSAGTLIMNLIKKHGAELIPVDSEHTALFQLLKKEDRNHIEKIILTASGGPFFNFSYEELKRVKKEDALNHPTYSMGAKITVDSSTLMNTGLEMIGAHFLFEIEIEKIDVVVHPQSTIHSFLEYKDGTLISQQSYPDMRIPIRYALYFPQKKASPDGGAFDFRKYSCFNFYYPDTDKFKCLKLAREAGKVKRSLPCCLNAANEVLVSRFLRGDIRWIDIAYKLEELISSHRVQDVLSLEDIIEVDKQAREEAQKI